MPTRGIRTFCHDLACSIPDTIRVNRGKMNLQELGENAIEKGSDRIILVDRWKGGRGRIRLYKLGQRKPVQVPPQIYIKAIKLRREFKVREKSVNSLIIARNLTETPSETMLLGALSDFLNFSLSNINEAGSDHEAAIQVYRGNGQLTHFSFFLLPRMAEIGPRTTISHLIWDIS